jgi:hypothetical protein
MLNFAIENPEFIPYLGCEPSPETGSSSPLEPGGGLLRSAMSAAAPGAREALRYAKCDGWWLSFKA